MQRYMAALGAENKWLLRAQLEKRRLCHPGKARGLLWKRSQTECRKWMVEKKDCETLSPEHGTDNKAMIFLLQLWNHERTHQTPVNISPLMVTSMALVKLSGS